MKLAISVTFFVLAAGTVRCDENKFEALLEAGEDLFIATEREPDVKKGTFFGYAPSICRRVENGAAEIAVKLGIEAGVLKDEQQAKDEFEVVVTDCVSFYIFEIRNRHAPNTVVYDGVLYLFVASKDIPPNIIHREVWY